MKEMFPRVESLFLFDFSIFVVTRQETIYDNNVKQYLLLSNLGGFLWYFNYSIANYKGN